MAVYILEKGLNLKKNKLIQLKQCYLKNVSCQSLAFEIMSIIVGTSNLLYKELGWEVAPSMWENFSSAGFGSHLLLSQQVTLLIMIFSKSGQLLNESFP